MSLILAAATAAVLATTATSQTDTTFAVASGTRLEVENFGGSITVTAWNKSALRVQAEHNRRTEIVVSREGAICGVDARNARGVPASVDYHFTVPAWMPLKLSGTYTDIAVSGVRSRVEAATVQGDVSLEGGAEYVALESVEGSVTVKGAKGRIEISAINDDVIAEDVEGELVIEAIDGDVWISGGKPTVVEASSVDGDIVYEGELKDGGRYELSTHDGDVALAVPEHAGVSVAIATFSGNFEAAFPIQLSETKRGKRFKFTLGDGGASASLESFGGTVYLVRPGSELLKLRPGEPADEPDPDHDHEKKPGKK